MSDGGFDREGATIVVVHPSCSASARQAIESVAGVEVLAPRDEAEVREALARSGVIVMHREGWRDEYLDGPLVWIQSQGSGYEDFPIERLREKGTILTTGRGLHSVCAEHAIALLLSLLRDTPRALHNMSERRWERYIPEAVAGRTVAIIGLGAIGEAVAERLQGWEVSLVGVTRSPDRYRGVVQDVRPLESISQAAAEASVLIVAIRSTASTRHLVTADVLDALGAGWLINIARGAVVDEAALIRRLEDGPLRGAGLDVFEHEPLSPASTLWTLPNVVLTPHMAGATPSHPERFARLFEQNLRAFRGEEPWTNRLI